MKRITRIVIALLLVLSTLSGCSAYLDSLPDMVYTYEDLTITLPGSFGDQSNEYWAAQLAFYYSYNSQAVFATKKPREEVEAEHPGMTALEYAQEFAEGTTIVEPVEEKDGLILFCHTMTNDSGIEFYYLCSAYVSEGYYWIIQCSSPTDIFTECRENMMKILRSVTLQ